MALLNRLFPTKKKSHEQGYVLFGKNDQTSWKPFNFSKDQVRLLLFRECDARGRKLLFDSSAVQNITLENQQRSKFNLASKTKCESVKKTETYVEVTNGVAYQYTRPNSDVNLIGEMIFGSVAMTFKGMSCKIHCIKSPDRVMCSRVFQAPTLHYRSNRRSDQSIDSSGSSVSSVNDSLFSLSGTHESKQKLNSSSGPLDVPYSDSSVKTHTNSAEGDSGFCGDASLHSMSSVGSNFWGPHPFSYDSLNSSSSTLGNSSHSGGSLTSVQRRWLKNVSTSLERGVLQTSWHYLNRKNSSGANDEISSRQHRKTQLGITVVINVLPEEESDMETFFFEHLATIEGMFERLQSGVERAYLKKDVFVHLMVNAFQDIQQWMCDLFTAPRLSCPVWIGLSSSDRQDQCSRFQHGVKTTFLRDFCQLIAAIDTKATNFFISTLVTAVLTHHLGWVTTIMPAKAPSTNLPKTSCASQMLHALAKSHPYNALWAQLGDLQGALGNPVKIARTIVTANGKKSELLNKLLTSLSYFIRSGNIEKRTYSEIVVGNELDILDSVIENFSSMSLHSSTASTVTIVPEDSVKECGQDSEMSSDSRLLNNCERTSSLNKKLGNDSTLIEQVNLGLPSYSKSDSLRKFGSLINSLNSSPEDENSKLYPYLPNIGDEYLNPDIISEKVSRLCRVPTNAVFYHLKNDEHVESLKTVLPKKVNCEKQLSSVYSDFNEKCSRVDDVNELEASFKADDSALKSNKGGVLFVLGDNDELVDLKTQSGFNIPKSKSENLLSIETLNCHEHVLRKSNCYPSLEGLSEKMGDSQFTEALQRASPKINEDHCETGCACEMRKVNSIERTRGESSAKCSSKCGLDSDILIERDLSREFFKGNRENSNERKNIWKNERTHKNDSESQTYSEISKPFIDVNGNPSSDLSESSATCKVITSHSFIIELEDVHRDMKLPELEEKFFKHVSRSQSLSFPDRKSTPNKRSTRICRRHSENMHTNERYFKDYNSVRFNFEQCSDVMSDFMCNCSLEKSLQREKKSNQIAEKRTNFELQDKKCEKCECVMKEMSVNSVLCKSDVAECKCKMSLSKEKICKNDCVLNSDGSVREGNALFDEYGRLSDDELLSSTEIIAEKKGDSEEAVSYPPSLVELPLPWYQCTKREQSCGLAASLLGGVSDHYMPDMVLHGCTQPLSHWEATLKHDLSLESHRPMLDQEVSEAVCIVGNADLWEVQLVSSHVSVVDKPGGFGIRVGMSQLVANMLESLLHLWKLRTPPDQCLQHLESKLRELCLRSQALAELLLTTELCDLATLTSSLGLEANDVPLLLAIASTHTPQVTNLYGVSFR